MANGLEAAASPLAIAQTGWQIIDLAQWIFNGDDTSKTRLEPMQIVTNSRRARASSASSRDRAQRTPSC